MTKLFEFYCQASGLIIFNSIFANRRIPLMLKLLLVSKGVRNFTLTKI